MVRPVREESADAAANESVRLTAAEFDQLTERALTRIAPRFRRRLVNVAIVVEAEPPKPGLLGLYQSRPPMPDQITIYQRPHERMARTARDLERIVAETLWHEIAHYFGMDERQVLRAERRRGHSS